MRDAWEKGVFLEKWKKSAGSDGVGESILSHPICEEKTKALVLGEGLLLA